MLKKLSLFQLALILILVSSFSASAQFDWSWGSSYSLINNTWSIPTPEADAFIQNYQSGDTGSSVDNWAVDTTNNVVLPETYEYATNEDGTSSIQEKPTADYSKYDDEEIVKPFQYPDDSTPVRIEFTLDETNEVINGDTDIVISMIDGKEYPSLNVDPYDNKIYDNYDFDGETGGKYARTKVGERILTGSPGYGYIYPDALYAVAGYPEDTPADNTDEESDTEIIDSSVCDNKTSVTFDVSGKVYHDPSGVEIKEAHYDPTVDKIFYIDDGQITESTYGTVLTLTEGCVNVDEASFAIQYPESIIKENEKDYENENGDSSELIGNTIGNYTDPAIITVPFPDVPNTKKYNSVRWMYSQSVVEGYSDGTFKPDKSVNRAEFLKMLYETVGLSGMPINNPFPDIPADAWYTKYVLEAYKDGVVEGYPDGYFRPENTINFAEAIKIVTNFFLNTDTRFAETSYSPCIDDLSEGMTGEWFWKYFHVADSLCVVPEDLFDGTFDPASQVTRFNMADLLYRAKAISENSYERFNDTLIPIDVYEP